MKRIIALLLPFIAFAGAASEDSGRKSRAESLGLLWQDSVRSGNTEAGKAKLTEFKQAGGDPYMVNLRAAYISYHTKKYDEASRFYAVAGKLQPGALSPLLGQFNIARAKGDEAAAASAGLAILKIEPTNYDASMAVAWHAFQTKNYPLAKRGYERMLTLYPEDLDAMSGTAWSAFYTGRKSEAGKLFRRLMSLSPDYPYVREGIAATTR